MSALPFRYTERRPSAALAEWVLSFWSFQADVDPAPDAPYIVWPDGCTSIALVRAPHVPRLIVCAGPRPDAMRPMLTAGMRLWGVRLWPDTSALVLGRSAQELRGHQGPASPQISAQFSTLDAALPQSDDPDIVLAAFDRWMPETFPRLETPDSQIRRAVSAIVAGRGKARVHDIARSAAMSARQLQRRFPAATGLTIREYSRIRRLREALAQRLDGPAQNWSRVAAEAGFVDHAHLTREFSALTSISPRRALHQLARTGHDAVRP